MKQISGKISILHNTNVGVVDTETDANFIRESDFIQIDNDPVFYTVAKKEETFYIQEFFVGGNDGRKLVIKDDIGIILNKNDAVTITIKEYKLRTLLDILEPGKNYKVGDRVYLNGGTLSLDQSTGLGTPCEFRVTEINENGGIKNVVLENPGIYFDIPENQNKLDGGFGSGAVFDVEFEQLKNRKILDRTIVTTTPHHLESAVYINYALPKGIKIGKISAQKWKIYLTANYLGDSKIETGFTVSRDYTANLRLPLMAKNSLSASMIYNHSIQKIDAELNALREEINKLKSGN